MRCGAMVAVAAVALTVTFPQALGAQGQTVKQFHVADLERLRSKFVGLAEAIPEDRYDHLSRSLAGMSDAARDADGRTFGHDMKVDAGITLAFSDLHEHLGQLIAYARTNRIVPPWSR